MQEVIDEDTQVELLNHLRDSNEWFSVGGAKSRKRAKHNI